MRMSCNGCRVLRKGCSDACTIRPCLQWIKTPEAEANATVFLAKFYGRAGLLNLLAAAPADHLRPAVFRSLLYEACGRIVNPVYGSVGLLWSGQWQACQAAVEAVLKGDPVAQVDAASDAAAAPPLLGARAPGAAAYDIRHVVKDSDAAAAADLLRVARGGRSRFKRASSSTSSKPHHKAKASNNKRASPSPPLRQQQEPEELEPEPMVIEHDEESAGSHDHHVQGSVDTDMEAGSHVSQAETEAEPQSHAAPAPVSSQVLAEDQEEEDVGLELALGLEPAAARQAKARSDRCDLSTASSLIGLRLELPA
ncbi:seed specific protein Bn15D17A [Panicum miliaceum]|uniref:Seed specific protein Bn15D17A n=1 Tax=Panicum miliaceum TaxID=4540 RepID=A0A3L6SRN3_PANMI|nr:seed specific protein Bn15D17A [Panicum miliaceum]